MTTLGFLNPKAGAGQSRLIFNLGWVLADAGFRVGLVDFDPQAGLSDLAGAAGDAPGSVYGALAPILEAKGTPIMPERLAPEMVELGSNLWLARGHIQVSVLDDAMTMAWALRETDSRAQLLVSGVVGLLEDVVELHQLDVVLCDVGPSLGPLNRAIAMVVDAIVVPLAPRAVEAAALGSLSSGLRHWRDPPWYGRDDPYRTLGFVVMRPSGVNQIGLDQLAAAYRSHLDGEHLGTIKEFPSLAAMARAAHKPEMRLERILYSELEDDLPDKLDALSTRTAVQSVDDIELGAVGVRRGGLRVVGSASVSHARMGRQPRRIGHVEVLPHALRHRARPLTRVGDGDPPPRGRHVLVSRVSGEPQQARPAKPESRYPNSGRSARCR